MKSGDITPFSWHFTLGEIQVPFKSIFFAHMLFFRLTLSYLLWKHKVLGSSLFETHSWNYQYRTEIHHQHKKAHLPSLEYSLSSSSTSGKTYLFTLLCDCLALPLLPKCTCSKFFKMTMHTLVFTFHVLTMASFCVSPLYSARLSVKSAVNESFIFVGLLFCYFCLEHC